MQELAAKLLSCAFHQIEVMHDYQGNRSCLYGSTTETESEAEDNPEQVARYAIVHLLHIIPKSLILHHFSLTNKLGA